MTTTTRHVRRLGTVATTGAAAGLADVDRDLVEHERTQPVRPATLESDVAVPLMQSAISALVAGIATGAAALALGWDWRAPVVAIGGTLAAAWLWRLAIATGTLATVERWLQRDIDGDGAIGGPDPAPAQTGGVLLANPDQARATVAAERQTAAAVAARDALRAFLLRCYAVGTSEAAHGVKASGANREHYVAARDVLLRLGIAAWRNPARPRAGWVMVCSVARAQRLLDQHVIDLDRQAPAESSNG